MLASRRDGEDLRCVHGGKEEQERRVIQSSASRNMKGGSNKNEEPVYCYAHLTESFQSFNFIEFYL